MSKKYEVFTEVKKGIIQAGFPDAPYYTNSTQLPADFGEDVFSALDLQDDLQKSYTGGCVEKGNYVATDKGDILIEELVERFLGGEKFNVKSLSPDTMEVEWDEVVDAMSIDVSAHDKIKVSFGDFSITTSDWHPFFVLVDGKAVEVRADALKAGDLVITESNKTYEVTSSSKVDVEDNQFYDLTTKKHHNYLCGKDDARKVFIHNTVFHIYSEEDVNGEEVKNLIRKVLSNYRLPYVSFTASFSVCPKHGRVAGLHEFCPYCDQEILAAHATEYDPTQA